MTETTKYFKAMLEKPNEFTQYLSGLRLRSYQQGVLESVFASVLNNNGFTFVVMFPRQSGKNELQAHLEVYLMTLLSYTPTELVKVSPTLKPQALTSMHRFERVARKNLLVKSIWKKEGSNSYRIGESRITFLSGSPTSNIVGATASGLLEVDEAQQISIEKYDRDISPMSASTNATHVFWGTAWTSITLLGRELRAAQTAEAGDGIRRVFRLTADEVSTEVEAYRHHVEEKIARLGRSHPAVRTQYFSEEVDGQGGMFPPDRIAKMRGAVGMGSKPTLGSKPTRNSITALLLDVAGEDEGVRALDGSMTLSNPSRDATALTLVEIIMEGQAETIGAGVNPARTEKSIKGAPLMPVYRPVKRWQWIGVSHSQLQRQIRDIALAWNARAVIVDATGVGAGLASFLDRALPGRVTPFNFNRSSKSQLGWDFLAIVDSFRWQEPALDDLPGDDQAGYQREFFAQLAACQFEVSSDAQHSMKWGVPETSRDPVSGELLHDDWVLSAALAAVLEKQDWSLPSSPLLIQGVDPLEEMDKGF